ncbi:hypothetical protein NDU88_002254 [Pleurodeles waltl]|uniref:Uncharacterized protein n=1 Tax=Pleurodeles waltl TaxID=8319 RepID=A0AAV7MPZ8_PLEWA|nr:hypothetical protein NDU88_002254 [Pleurodeles waltl]
MVFLLHSHRLPVSPHLVADQKPSVIAVSIDLVRRQKYLEVTAPRDRALLHSQLRGAVMHYLPARGSRCPQKAPLN